MDVTYFSTHFIPGGAYKRNRTCNAELSLPVCPLPFLSPYRIAEHIILTTSCFIADEKKSYVKSSCNHAHVREFAM